MEKKFFTVEQIGELLKMHPKTIQRYIREGKLRAVKYGKGWRISGHDLSVFTESASYEEARQGQSFAASGAERAVASAVVDMTVSGREEAIRILNALTAGLNAKPREFGSSSMQAQYIEQERKVRVTLWGEPAVVAAVLSSVSELTKREE
ncbi:MAG: helix-turn-helix domain-containing protein [Clostridiaceae bacterium]